MYLGSANHAGREEQGVVRQKRQTGGSLVRRVLAPRVCFSYSCIMPLARILLIQGCCAAFPKIEWLQDGLLEGARGAS